MPDRPNILVILTDQHSPHVLGCAGDPVVRTPRFDQLASEGMRFDNVYCPAPVCTPSRMSFMTCRTPSHTRVWHNEAMLDPGMPTWAHVLGMAGYETSLVGRMHFEGNDQRHGFENRPIGEHFAIHPGQHPGERYPSGQHRSVVELSGYGSGSYVWHDERITEAACQYLTERTDRDRPFAAVVGFVLPHCPFIAPRDLFEYYHDRVTIPEIEEEHPPMIQWYRRSRKQDEPPIDPVHVRAARAAYYGLCEYVDRLTGNILDTLEQTGLADNTLVIYTSDHGEMAGEHGCWTKNVYYQASVRVPMIARWPGVTPAGSTCPSICSLMDLGATFADIAGAESTTAWDGRSIAPFLRDEPNDGWDNYTVSEVVDSSIDPLIPSRMIRRDRWKLWVHLDHDDSLPVSLFDLEADPNELNDLADDPNHAEVRDALFKEVMREWDPHANRATATRQKRDYFFIRPWGAKLAPKLPDLMPAAPDDLEDDVVIIKPPAD